MPATDDRVDARQQFGDGFGDEFQICCGMRLPVEPGGVGSRGVDWDLEC
jgi:hypothetical protein